MYKCMILTCQYTCKIFSRKKSNRVTVQKQNTYRLNCSRPFHLLSIRSKKIECSEFHKQIQDFELPTSWDFFLKGKKAGKHYQNVSLIPRNTSRPFYLLSLHSKKNYSSELHKQVHDFDLSIHFTCFLKMKRAGKNYITMSPKFKA